MKALIGQKLGMTQIFDTEGNAVPVTVIQAGPCVVTQVKTQARDGYNAVQLGFGEAKRVNKPQQGHLKPSKANPRVVREFRIEPVAGDQPEASDEAAEAIEQLQLKVGQKLDVSGFAEGDAVRIIGTSKGKGFAGTIKRYNFHRGPKTHGSHNYRARGSIGSMYPQHVFKGIKMAGRMGGQRVTTGSLKVVQVVPEQNLLAVRGAVPGPRKSYVLVEGA